MSDGRSAGTWGTPAFNSGHVVNTKSRRFDVPELSVSNSSAVGFAPTYHWLLCCLLLAHLSPTPILLRFYGRRVFKPLEPESKPIYRTAL